VNILYINHYAGGPQWGMEFRPYYLAREWVRAGHQVTMVAASQSHVRAIQPTATGRFTHERVDGIEYVWCDTPAYRGNGVGRVLNILSFLWRLRQWRQWLRQRPDVVIASSTYPADIAAARRIARKHGAVLVWEVHDLWPLSPIELSGVSKWHPFILWMQYAENKACKVADVVVSMLPCADQHLVAHGMNADKFVCIPNGIDPQEWSGDAAALEPEILEFIHKQRSLGRVVVGYAGSHGLPNALDTFLDAALLLKDAKLAFVLVGDGHEKAALQARVRDLGLKNVAMFPPVPKRQIPGFLSAVDVAYIGWQKVPIYRFGIAPNKLMDYMMAGCAVLHSVEAGNDPVAEAGCGLTVAPADPQAVANGLLQLEQLTPSQRQEMGQRGHEYVVKHHVYPVLARRFISAIENALSAR
jgi:glycosyltransferase involved in cell wall biosynthesis